MKNIILNSFRRDDIALLATAEQISANVTPSRRTRPGLRRKPIHSIELPVSLNISAKEVPQHNVPEYGCKNCPTASAIAAALGRSSWRELFSPSNRAPDRSCIEHPSGFQERVAAGDGAVKRTEMIEQSDQNAV